MHVLILGRTGQGKSTLLRQLSRQYQKAGVRTLLFTTVQSASDRQSFSEVYYDRAQFMQRVFASTRCCVFIDEAGEMVNRSLATETQILATRTRHLGHSVHFAAQRAAMIVPTVRDQCERAYIFRVSWSDAKALADEYGEPDVLAARSFRKGEYIVVDERGAAKRVLDFSNIYGRS